MEHQNNSAGDRGIDRLSLIAFIAVNALVSVTGGWVTANSVQTWYPTLDKPGFNPPDWVFGPVWTILFVMIALAGWRVWRRRGTHAIGSAMAVYALQLGLNLGWSILFFGMRRIDLAATEIFVLLAMIGINLYQFSRIDRMAALLLLPYLFWVGFAALLTVRIWQLNV